MINPEADADKEQIALLVQRALVLLGSASHSISLERRKIAWARINPTLKSLASEDYTDRKDKLFGSGFLEKVAKKLEALAKVTAPHPQSRKRRATTAARESSANQSCAVTTQSRTREAQATGPKENQISGPRNTGTTNSGWKAAYQCGSRLHKIWRW